MSLASWGKAVVRRLVSSALPSSRRPRVPARPVSPASPAVCSAFGLEEKFLPAENYPDEPPVLLGMVSWPLDARQLLPAPGFSAISRVLFFPVWERFPLFLFDFHPENILGAVFKQIAKRFGLLWRVPL